jgi:hypothetical protein
MRLAKHVRISILASCNGSPAGYFAMSPCEPRQDRKVATVAGLMCAGALLVGLSPEFEKPTHRGRFFVLYTRVC